REGAAEAPTVHHRDGRLGVVHQRPPLPGAGRTVGAHAFDVGDAVGYAEEVLEVHTGREGFAHTGEHDDTAAVIDLEHVEDRVRLLGKRSAHGVRLCRAVELHPGDAVLEFHEHIVAPGLGLGGSFGGHLQTHIWLMNFVG